MKKGARYAGEVIRVDFPNKGIVRVDGEKVAVKNVLPGQNVSFVISKVRKGKIEGKLVEVLSKSPLETEEPGCIHFGFCGGCAYQAIAYDAQLGIKEEQIKHLLDEVCPGYRFEGIKGSPIQWGYRNKMEFTFGDEREGGSLALGLHKRGSFYDILTTDHCQIADADYNKILVSVLGYFVDLGMSYYKRQSHTGYLRHLVIRKAAKTGEILVNLATSSQWGRATLWQHDASQGKHEASRGEHDAVRWGHDVTRGEHAATQGEHTTVQNWQEHEESETADTAETAEIAETAVMEAFKNRLLELDLCGSIVGILHTYNDSKADVVQSDRIDILFGRDYLYEELLGMKFKVSAFSFFQTNSLAAEVLYSTIREYTGDTRDKLILDLYSGTGTIAQVLAPAAKKVIGVEIVEEAVMAARENATLNGLGNCEFIAGDVLEVLDKVTDKPDLVVLDPPRDGIHPKALEKIIELGVDRIVYVSCKPTSLARDLAVLRQRGYKAERACCVDMFPHTPHVECVTLMSRVEE
ncbi:MAG: 23S rRNA (uracil(1939)-C(5))-methyltransferase RlmD [Clostridiaceae bacterium]|nr:23S rRNA (uracil(1939)-C(5))-methyltransferase RlmD [Clostridiaceae bacterium]